MMIAARPRVLRRIVLEHEARRAPRLLLVEVGQPDAGAGAERLPVRQDVANGLVAPRRDHLVFRQPGELALPQRFLKPLRRAKGISGEGIDAQMRQVFL